MNNNPTPSWSLLLLVSSECSMSNILRVLAYLFDRWLCFVLILFCSIKPFRPKIFLRNHISVAGGVVFIRTKYTFQAHIMNTKSTCQGMGIGACCPGGFYLVPIPWQGWGMDMRCLLPRRFPPSVQPLAGLYKTHISVHPCYNVQYLN